MSRYHDAIKKCARGLTIDPQFPELAWLIAWCQFELGNFQDCVVWSHLAMRLGKFDGIGTGFTRIGFRNLLAWYDGPLDLLVHAYRTLGNNEMALFYEEKRIAAKEMRMAAQGELPT